MCMDRVKFGNPSVVATNAATTPAGYPPALLKEIPMRIGGSLFLIALGAILRFAITVHGNTHGFDIHAIGVILMVVGAVGLVASAIWMSTRRRTDVITHTPTGTRGTTYVEPNAVDGPY